jgi:hypothetical protein
MTPTELRAEIQRQRDLHYEHACDLSDEGREGSERAYGRVDAYDDILELLDEAEQARTSIQWAVAYGCPSGDPNEAAGVLGYDDEEDAREHLQWIRGSILARRTVTASRWEAVSPDA